MFKNIAEIVSGKRARKLRLQGAVFAEPMSRFQGSKDARIQITSNFATALGFTTSGIVEAILLDSSPSYLSDLTASLDATRLRSLAAYIAWWIVMIYQTDGKELAQGDPDALESLGAWIPLTSRIQELMYPQTDSVLHAIEAHRDAEQRFLNGAALVDPHQEGIRAAIGLPPSASDNLDLNQVFQDELNLAPGSSRTGTCLRKCSANYKVTMSNSHHRQRRGTN